MRRAAPARVLITELIALCWLCWPAFLNQGHAIVFSDTHAYFVAGRSAFDKISGLFYRAGTGGGGGGGLDEAIQKARAVRSPFYSLFTFATAASVSLWLTILLQAAMTLAVLHLAFRLLCRQEPPLDDRSGSPSFLSSWQFVILLALGTTISWAASTAMPDVFTPLVMLLAIVVILFWHRLSVRERVFAFVGIAAGLTMHLSNPVILVGVLLVALVVRLDRLWAQKVRYVAVAGALALALSATLLASVVGFKQWTLTPNQPPFLLAHSIADGPTRLFLRNHCPQAGYAMCRHLDRLDVSADDFIWHENGVYSVVSLDEAAAIRAEEKQIFVEAALEHPLIALGTTLRDAAEQVLFFTLQDYYIPSYGYAATDVPINMPAKIVQPYSYDGGNKLDLTMWIRPAMPDWQQWLAVPEYVVVAAAFLYCMYLWLTGQIPQRDQRDFLILILAVVIINGAVTALSDTAARYEARVIWLIPMTALVLLVNRQQVPTMRSLRW